jgi:hypothetical protein
MYVTDQVGPRSRRAIALVLGAVLLPATMLSLITASPAAAAGPRRPGITTNVSASSIAPDQSVTDTATLANVLASARGTITFAAFGPNDADCSQEAVFASTVTASEGDGAYISDAFHPTAAGTYRFVASYEDGEGGPALSGLCNDANETVEVSGAGITTHVNADTVDVGQLMLDIAAITNVPASASGTITFSAYGPNDANCEGAAAATSTVPAQDGAGSYASDPFNFTSAGTYRFIASYAGDGVPNVVTGACNDIGETVVVRPSHSATISTHASASSVSAGTPISDTATLGGLFSPPGGGVITFQLFGPDDGDCTGTSVYDFATGWVNGQSSYSSGTFTPTAAGTYRWIARFSGDANNDGVSGPCNDPDETVVVEVNKGTPTIITQVGAASVPLGSNITDTATLGGVIAAPAGTTPGTVIFNIYGPGDTNCTGTPFFTSIQNAHGNGDYASAPFRPQAAGTYRFKATYSGDASNADVTDPCNAPNETVEVNNATTTVLASSLNPSVYGQAVTFKATVAPVVGSGVPTGFVTFYDGTTSLGTATVAGNPATASLTTSTLSAATHPIKAVYGGAALLAGSTSAVVNQVVNKVAVRMTAAPAVLQQSPLALPLFKLQATLVRASDGAPLGGQTIRFTSGTTVLCQSVTAANGTAVCDATLSLLNVVLALGYNATYDGSANYLGQTAAGPLVK